MVLHCRILSNTMNGHHIPNTLFQLLVKVDEIVHHCPKP
uniref:Uncharacterized protein n=1 Tax=Rhizophora mucronata TaxID=61149 RepID=A0A2P2NYE1_RHIMU